MCEYGSEVVWVDLSVVLIPLFGVDVPTVSQCVGLGTQLTGSEADDEVKLRGKLRPAGLSASKEFGGCKVLKVLMVSDNVNWSTRTFEVMPPSLEHFEDGEEFLVMSVVVEFGAGEGA